MKLVYRSFQLVVLFVIAITYTACDILDSGSDEDLFEPDKELYHLCTVESGGYTVEAYADHPVETAYTPIYLDVRETESNDAVEEADISILPVMDMGEHEHAAPVWQPEPVRDEDTNLFEAAIIPNMPGGDMGGWSLEWQLNGQDHSVSKACEFDVADAPNVQVFTGEDDERYILTWIEPEQPETGSNELVLALHRRESMMSFPPVQDLNIEIKPWMGSMDHGSEGNEHPEPVGDGFYEGGVNFNMSGDWQVYVTLKEGEAELYEAKYELTVE